MKTAVLVSLLLCIACNSDSQKPQTNSNGYMDERRADELTVSYEDYYRLDTICKALREKENRLGDLITSEYTFDYQSRDCNADALKSQTVKVSIQKPGDDYVFRPSNGEPFSFQNVETSTSGVMSKVCAQIGDFKNPIISGSSAYWITTFVRSEHCRSDENGICVFIEKGSQIRDGIYGVHAREYLKFKTRNPRMGFFTERKLITSADCSNGKTIERRAYLK